MSIDDSTHTLFGASKVAADVLVQEYGRYFGMKTACFRGGCLTGPAPRRRRAARLPRLPDEVRRHRPPLHGLRLQGQAGARQHPQRTTWCNAFWHFAQSAARRRGLQHRRRPLRNCSMLEAIALCEEITGRKLNWTYADEEPHRRPHLVGQRLSQLPGRLPGMAAHLRSAHHAGRHSRARPRALG